MLHSLSIRNVVLIEKLDINFKSGLSVFTGETGAGKSILLDSLALVLGGRADTKLIRHKTDGLTVSAVFSIPLAHPAHLMLVEQGFDSDGEVILRRTLTKDGKSKAFINDQPVSVSFLKSIGDTLVEIHGQFASHRLLNPATHLDVLDLYGILDTPVTHCRRAYTQWKYKQSERDKWEQKLMFAKEEEAFIRDSVAQLNELKPVVGEEASLTEKRTMLMNAEKIAAEMNEAYGLLAHDTTGADNQILRSCHLLEKANALSNGAFDEVLNMLSGAQETVADVIALMEQKIADFTSDEKLESIDDRLFALKDAARKHKVTIDELPNLLVELEKKLNDLDTGDQMVVQLKKEEEKARLDYITCAQKLSKNRQKTAASLDKLVNAELPALKLNKARFKTNIEPITDEDEWTEHGVDKVSFLVSTNAGTPLGPIAKIASGGELNRFMLALKVILAKSELIPTIVFDEVDTGIGGATADAVGERLKKLAKDHQVLVVTHSPQVASYGAHHWCVSKKETDTGVTTDIELLNKKGRLMEIARMLSGAKVTESAQHAAKELLEKTCKNPSTN